MSSEMTDEFWLSPRACVATQGLLVCAGDMVQGNEGGSVDELTRCAPASAYFAWLTQDRASSWAVLSNLPCI